MRLMHRRLKPKKFKNKWAELQKLCVNKETWSDAVLAADKLLDEALKKRRLKGKSMGERLVSAQRRLTDNDSAWCAHNFAKKIKADTELKLNKTSVKKSLVGFRQALRDLGALND